MVKITNGVDAPIEVTRGAYEGVFKPLGYYPVDEAKNAQEASDAATKHDNQQGKQEQPDIDPDDDELDGDDADTEDGEDNADADEFAELEQKPIGQWTKDEVKAYAEAKGIDLKGTKNVNEAKARVKDYLNKAE